MAEVVVPFVALVAPRKIHKKMLIRDWACCINLKNFTEDKERFLQWTSNPSELVQKTVTRFDIHTLNV